MVWVPLRSQSRSQGHRCWVQVFEFKAWWWFVWFVLDCRLPLRNGTTPSPLPSPPTLPANNTPSPPAGQNSGGPRPALTGQSLLESFGRVAWVHCGTWLTWWWFLIGHLGTSTLLPCTSDTEGCFLVTGGIRTWIDSLEMFGKKWGLDLMMPWLPWLPCLHVAMFFLHEFVHGVMIIIWSSQRNISDNIRNACHNMTTYANPCQHASPCQHVKPCHNVSQSMPQHANSPFLTCQLPTQTLMSDANLVDVG